MSFETWSKEFYPVEADSPEARKDPLNHSLRKWQGLTAGNLRKHGLKWSEIYDDAIIEIEHVHNIVLMIDDSSCACCQVSDEDCKKCPIYKTLGGDVCEDTYFDAIENQAPGFMIKLLRKVISLQKKAKKNKKKKQKSN